MATQSSVLAWRIPGTGEPGGLPSMGLHRVGHDCSNLAAGSYNTTTNDHGKNKVPKVLTHARHHEITILKTYNFNPLNNPLFRVKDYEDRLYTWKEIQYCFLCKYRP